MAMLLKLHPQHVMGLSIVDQILDHLQEMIVAGDWPENIRPTKDIITELGIVVSGDDFSNTLNRYHAFLYVGAPEGLPRTFASFYRSQPFKDWIILLKPKDNHLADPVYVFSAASSVAYSPTLH
jgi:hypothetical protein